MVVLQEKHGLYDPLELYSRFEPVVAPYVGGEQYRRYYRFRRDRWYGGIITGDTVGCNLRCGFCWAYYFTWGGFSKGELYSPLQAVEILTSLARRHGINRIRLSGGEPTLGFDHLIKVIELITSRGYHFILETNGVVIGSREEYARRLASFHGAGVSVRVSIKGTSPQEFVMLTRAEPRAWGFQLKAIKLLVEYGLEPGEEVYPAVMLSFTDSKGVERIKRVLRAIHPRLAESIDPEYVILYPHVVNLLKTTGLKPLVAFKPDELPSELI